jgi:hypothetical protein
VWMALTDSRSCNQTLLNARFWTRARKQFALHWRRRMQSTSCLRSVLSHMQCGVTCPLAASDLTGMAPHPSMPMPALCPSTTTGTTTGTVHIRTTIHGLTCMFLVSFLRVIHGRTWCHLDPHPRAGPAAVP